MKRELVKCLRTPALLAMFSQDPTTVTNIQGCLKSMSLMEPDLILHPILERAVPSLEALVEVGRFYRLSKIIGSWIWCFIDWAHPCCHQSIGGYCPRHRLSWCLLPWCQTPCSSASTAHSGNWSSQLFSLSDIIDRSHILSFARMTRPKLLSQFLNLDLVVY